VQAESPLDTPYVPDAQLEHEDLPDPLVKVPTAQLVQELALLKEN